MAGYMPTAQRDDWCTPDWLVDAVCEAFGGAPDLDPCSNAQSIVGARRSLTREDDGLAADWGSAKTVYVNPPYGRELTRWVGRCVQANRDHGCEVILLVPAAVSTRRWHELAVTAACVCFLRGRVKFIGATTGAPFASAVLYWGRRPDAFEAAFGRHGAIYEAVG